MTRKERARAIQNAIPQKPIRVELGGGYYYKCHWIKCNEQLRRWWEYCPNCGNKIDWSEIDDI